MPQLQLLDTYVERSVSLLEASPSDTLVSVTYHTKPSSNNKKKQQLEQQQQQQQQLEKEELKPSYSFISFKTYNPHSGTCYKFKTSKAKDLSRILSALGPRGVQFTKTKSIKKNHTKVQDGQDSKVTKSTTIDKKDSENEKVKQALEEKYIVHGKGFASLMSNTEFQSEEPESGPASASTAEPTSATGNSTPVAEGTAAEIKTETVTAGTSKKKNKKGKKKGKK